MSAPLSDEVPDLEAIRERVEKARRQSPASLIVRDFTVLLSYTSALQDALRLIEWVPNIKGGLWCPMCFVPQGHAHLAECRIKALLAPQEPR